MAPLARTVSFLCLFVFVTAHVFAQNSAGSLGGTVTDPNGGAVAGAKVTATHDSTRRQFTTVSSSEGLYVFQNLDIGFYTLTVEATGFKKLSGSGVMISISTRSTLDWKLEVGDVTQTVAVTADVTQLQTQSAEIGTTFPEKLFRDAPFAAGGIRNPEQFVQFQAGVVNGAGAEGGISGGARRSKEILIDGTNATNPESGGVAFNGLPSVESLGEFKVINNTFAAEYGRTGGGIESFVTASGGSQFHGNVFEHHGSSALSANSWANNASGVRKAPTHGNNYGFALGGPIYLPKKVFGPIGGYNENRDRTFFLITLENFRQTSSAASFRTVPTLKQREGDFSELLPARAIYDPVTGNPFNGNIISPSRFSRVSRNVLAVIPRPTNSALQNNYLGTTTTNQKYDTWSIKINHNISDKHIISGYYTDQDLGVLADGPLPYPLMGANNNAVSANRPIFVRFNYDWIISPTINFHANYGITKLRQYFDNQSVGKGWPQALGLTGVADGETSAFPVVQFTERYTNYADTNGTKTKGTQFNYTDHVRGDLSWVKGNFNWKFGFDFRWMRTTGDKLPTGGADDAGVQGVFNFAPLQTASPLAPSTTGDAFASLLLGLVDNANRTFNASFTTAKFGYYGGYGQTAWRVRPNLTVELGLRYEIPVPRRTDPPSFTSFDPNIVDPHSGLKGALAYAGDCSTCNGRSGFGDVDYSSVAPRLGLAWSWNQKTVLRAGYGLYYAAGNGLTGGFCIRCQNGYSTTAAVSKGAVTSAALNWDNGFVPPATFIAPPVVNPSAGNTADDIWYINPKSGQAPRFQNFSLSIQRELPWKFVAEIAYIGIRGERLSVNHFPLNHLDPKYYALGSLLERRIDDPLVVAAGYKSPYPLFIADWGSTATLARALRAYPHINGPVNDEYNPVGQSWYDSMQLKLDRRFGSFYGEFNYTWSKSLTNASGSQTSGDETNRNPKTTVPYNPRVLEIEKSFLYTDYPHIFNAVIAWDLPFGRGKRFASGAAMDRLLGGWTITFAGQYTSGALILLNAPMTYPQWGGFLYGRKEVNIIPGKAIRTNVNRSDLDPRNTSIRWLNTDFFSIPGTYELGNSPTYLNELRDPPVYGDSMGFIKRTRIKESANFEIRAEFFNIFNRTNFGIGGTPPRPNPVDLTRFGVPNGPRSGPRTGQIVVKLNF